MATVTQIGARLGIAPTCAALGLPRATYYRRRRPARVPLPRRPPPRALSPGERDVVLALLHEPRFVDHAPAEVYATLLDAGQYVCSERTMYRLLAEHAEVRERRDQLRHPVYAAPELLARRPNELWSWDITKLLGPVKWTYYYLYVVLDIYSRYVVGWMLATRESGSLAERLLADSVRKQSVEREQLTIHADRGSSMSSKPVALMLADLGVTKSHSRPHCSNDNPYSEAQFKTLKYRPEFPDRFGSAQGARVFSKRFFDWYNDDHRHSGIGYHTPADVHYGRAGQVRGARAVVLSAAHAAHPERFVRKPPEPPQLPRPAWINRPTDQAVQP